MKQYDPDRPQSPAQAVSRVEGGWSRPQISVVVPAHNDVNFIRACLESLLNQQLQPAEIIICDDASSDGTREVVHEYRVRFPDLIKIVCHDTNVGCARNFNSGIEVAKGSHVSIVAADDYWLPHKLANEVVRMRESHCAWCYSAVELRWENGSNTGRSAPFWGTSEGASGDIFDDILLRRISPRNFLIERKALTSVGAFDPAFGMYEDWDLKLRLADRFPAAFSSIVAAVYRQHDKGISRSSAERQLTEAGKVLRKNAKLIRRRTGGAYRRKRDTAFLGLLPDRAGNANSGRGVPRWLDLPYLPRTISARGEGLVFAALADRSSVLDALSSHPDVAVGSHTGLTSRVLADLCSAGGPSPIDRDAGVACLFSFYRDSLIDSGKSRLLVTENIDAEKIARLREVFPDACFIIESSTGIRVLRKPNIGTRSANILDQDISYPQAGDRQPSLFESLGLPAHTHASDNRSRATITTRSARSVLTRGEKFFAEGDFDSAERLFRAALATDGTATEAYNNLGVVLWKKGCVAGALDAFSEGLARDASHRDLLRNLIQVLLEVGQTDEAERFIIHYLNCYPGERDVIGAMAGQYCLSGV
jgi:glycosyltransferase involved in cell wall biosynthesis